ncbi:DUF2569 family protein [Halomonas sp. Y3S6]|uniref:DUF2569 family protein n=1 Tax=Billgrantia antri TaxID=2846777 RepID=A0ABS6ZJG2_9GAMM|nr:DUF2569 family protein [Halomonas antri]
MLVLVGVLMVAVPLVGVGSLLSNLAILKHLHPSLVGTPGWDWYLLWMWLAVGCAAGLSVYASLRLLHGKSARDVEAVCSILWVIGPIAAIVTNGLIPFMMHEAEMLMYDYIGPTGVPLVGAILGGAIFSLVWTSYLSRSQRVRNTYPQAQVEAQRAGQ